MEVLPEGKNFRLVKDEELPEICTVLEKYLPEALKFHQTIKTYLNDRVWDFHFYVSKNWPEQPVILHFPGMTKTPNDKLYESFSVFCPCDTLENLELLAEEDVLLDWSEPLYTNFTHRLIMEQIEKFYEGRGTMEKVAGDVYICSNPTDDLDDEIYVPAEDAAMLQLKTEHAQAIHDLYPANDMESIEVFEKLINALPAYGVFSSTGELAAWMVQSYYGAMFSMQTKPEFRRKGYGIHLAKYLTKVVKDRGYLPFVVIRPENEASRKLYTKLGFTKIFETVRAILRPYGNHHGHLENNETILEEPTDIKNMNGDDDTKILLQKQIENGSIQQNGGTGGGGAGAGADKHNGEMSTMVAVHENGDCTTKSN